jgi:hypothetical protein
VELDTKSRCKHFLNIASTESQDRAYKITLPARLVVNERNLFNLAPHIQRKVDRMGKSAEFKVIIRVPSGDPGERLAGSQIDWLMEIS